ncbi:MAG TPA: cytochrome b/b6 domain-containing protein [Anaerolineales bacterium]|nr:cytochrome b/b6 domain-containing protein [Anaerolineales bacterium]
MTTPAHDEVRTERTFPRFNLGQRWEHALIILTFTVLLLTGLPQKYRNTSWSHYILATPERVELVQTIHRTAAAMFVLEALYHVGRGLVLMARRKLSGDIFPTGQDVRDAGQMIRYLLFLAPRPPRYGKYSFEQKFTYWFIFFGFGILIVSGLLLWFPTLFTRLLPGGIIPAAKLAHSSEAIVSAIFVVLWHFYHVHLERLNFSIFTGRLNERDMRRHHALEFERLTGEPASDETPGDGE